LDRSQAIWVTDRFDGNLPPSPHLPPFKLLLNLRGLKLLKLMPCADYNELRFKEPNAQQVNIAKTIWFLDKYKSNFGGRSPLVITGSKVSRNVEKIMNQ
jgi:hypothetical protein